MGGNKQIISLESTVLWTQPSCIAHCSVEFLLHLIGFGGLDLALVVEKGEVCKKSRDYHVYNNAQAKRLAVKGLGTRLNQGI